MSLRLRAVAALLTAMVLAAPALATPNLAPLPVPAITVLLFHQIDETPITSAAGEDNVKRPWVTPAAFDAFLTGLERDGYHYVTLRDALAFFSGARVALPARPVLLTFDDGFASAWTAATPVLRRHHATATMFFEGQLTDTKPGRLTTAQLREMQQSGIWTLESHGWIGHGNIVVDANGTSNPYWYANLMWLADKNRLETLDEYEARIREDLHRFRTTFEPVLGQPVTVFAYPSGEFGQNAPLLANGNPRTRVEAGHSNARGLQDRLEHALRAEGFTDAFAVSIPGNAQAATAASDPLAIPRLGIGADTQLADVEALAPRGLTLPGVSFARDQFSDPGPIAAFHDGYLVAATEQPELYELDRNGRLLRTWRIPALDTDRGADPVLISGLAVRGNVVSIVQQSGWRRNAVPRVIDVQLSDPVKVLGSRTLRPSLNWTTGVIDDGKLRRVMTDDGALYDLDSETLVTRIEDDGRPRRERYTGPAVLDGQIVAVDRLAHRLLWLDASGKVVQSAALPGDVRYVAAEGNDLLAVDWTGNRRMLVRYQVGR